MEMSVSHVHFVLCLLLLSGLVDISVLNTDPVSPMEGGCIQEYDYLKPVIDWLSSEGGNSRSKEVYYTNGSRRKTLKREIERANYAAVSPMK